MKYKDFVGQVQRRAQIDSARDAERAIQATLEALSDALFDGDTEDLARQLPAELAECLRQPDPRQRARARRGPDTRDRTGSEPVPRDRGSLDQTGLERRRDVLLDAERPEGVGHREGMNQDITRRTAGPSQLAEAPPSDNEISAHVGDRQVGLPGPDEVGAQPTELQEPEGLPRMVHHVAEREGTNETQARAHVKAVFQVLTRAVDERELSDLRDHLPPDIARLFEEGGPDLPRA